MIITDSILDNVITMEIKKKNKTKNKAVIARNYVMLVSFMTISPGSFSTINSHRASFVHPTRLEFSVLNSWKNSIVVFFCFFLGLAIANISGAIKRINELKYVVNALPRFTC
jgi:hypothetical protein